MKYKIIEKETVEEIKSYKEKGWHLATSKELFCLYEDNKELHIRKYVVCKRNRKFHLAWLGCDGDITFDIYADRNPTSLTRLVGYL